MTKTNKYKAKEKLHWFEIFSAKAIKITGSSRAFIIACILIIIWIITGPLFHYSDLWQLAINTGTTITFLMVFLIQKTQNKEALAIQIKLNELVAANIHASNRMVSIEDLSEIELERLNE
jgi:low affinity Fe/Cu permease